jgi:hypothetical protein
VGSADGFARMGHKKHKKINKSLEAVDHETAGLAVLRQQVVFILVSLFRLGFVDVVVVVVAAGQEVFVDDSLSSRRRHLFVVAVVSFKTNSSRSIAFLTDRRVRINDSFFLRNYFRRRSPVRESGGTTPRRMLSINALCTANQKMKLNERSITISLYILRIFLNSFLQNCSTSNTLTTD